MRLRANGRAVLFLDFDGVLHPMYCPDAEHFCRLPLFEAAMRGCPEVRIVISSSWRRIYGIEWLRARFSRDIAIRIDGTTQLWVPEDPINRYEEIMAYAEKQGLPQSTWLALDDSALEFPQGCANLLLCDSRIGLTDAGAEELAQRLSRLVGG